MSIKILLINLIVSCLLAGQAHSEVPDKSQDKYGALEIDTDELSGGAIQKLNDFLVERTDSADPVKNLDIIIQEVNKDYKNKVSLEDDYFQAKRLVASLSTITDANQCSSYSFKILQACLNGMETGVRNIVRNVHLRRIDKILAHYIRKHVNDCRDVYFEEFSRISKQLDKTQVSYLDTFLNKAIDNLVNKKRIKGESRAERLYNAGKHELNSSFDLLPKYIYETLKVVARGDPNEKYLKPVENERTGYDSVNREKFEQLIEKYLLKPCEYYTQQFGVFGPFHFDSMFDQHVQSDMVDFYEGWLKFRFCSFDVSNGYLTRKVADYVDQNSRRQTLANL